MAGESLLLRNGRPLGGAPADVLVTGGVIAAIGPGLVAPFGTPVEKGLDLLKDQDKTEACEGAFTHPEDKFFKMSLVGGRGYSVKTGASFPGNKQGAKKN